MTIAEVCQLLKVHRGKRVWEILPEEGNAAGIRGRTPRGFRKDCPLTFLAHVLTGRRQYPDEYLVAARRLGISPSVARAIAEASDFTHLYRQPIRVQILRALEL